MIAIITPDRGDRPEFLDHCRYQVQRQTVKYLHHFVIDFAPLEGVVDIVPRIKEGLKQAAENGFRYVMIFENDDYYPDNYVEKMQRFLMSSHALVGLDETMYYSLQQKGYRSFYHKERSSLFTTGLSIKEMRTYRWPEDEMLYFDRHLWASNLSRKTVKLCEPPIGIKHGAGFCPGNYHNGICNGKQVKDLHKDPGLHWLRRHVRPESFDFYYSLILKQNG